jgi:ABC-type sugar transport system permease subunit
MFAAKRRFTLQRQDTIVAWLLILPALIIILGITLQPILSTLYLSFFSVSSGINTHSTFIGFGNYTSLLQEATFWQTIGRTFYFTTVSVALEMILGIAIAQFISSHPPGWKFLRISLIIPWAIPTIVNGSMWRWIYNSDYGALNALLSQIGLIGHYVPWLIDATRAMNLVILADVWHSVPFIALLMQAAMATLSPELDEAAAVDGATAWQRFWRIRLPLLRPAILVALIIRSVEAFRVFDIVYVITQGGPASGTTTISYQTYLETFSYTDKLGRGAALSFLVSIFTLIMAFLYLRFLYQPHED